MLVLVISGLSSAQSGRAGVTLDVLASLVLLTVVGVGIAMGGASVRRIRRETGQVDSIGELVQLQRWSEAAVQLELYLSSPTRTWGLRAQALAYLAAVLGRYQRHEDAITVLDHLLDSGMIEAGSAVALRLGRATAMLREDHLVDADRALSELRRGVNSEVGQASLALLELYRDVKTGHHADAVERFKKSHGLIRQWLGHRVADAWALVARSLDVLNQPQEAHRAFQNATLLCPPGELFRRYPEVARLQGRYEPAYAPDEAA